ncbi:LysR family transcriptional regulator [Longimycelium tulufanense]|uniref:LysR family transcriptional regulator n=1 Tax=Longimycelium tulufanense TaxID=907463 RepID=A0A8J3FVW0_9PSEU|nr:LysR family transcriptional regulator [Longimycelium tulufanense]GGM71990.1 LysR family transcriptional regulator [Longimycelium tulufanense]
MSLRQLEYFLAALDEGGISRAAEQLFITQSALSQQIHALERSVGTRLLHRGRDGVRPTAAGAAFAQHARTAVASARQAWLAARGVAEGAPPIRLGLLSYLIDSYLPAYLRQWLTRQPDARLIVRAFVQDDQLLVSLDCGEVEVAIGPSHTNRAFSHSLGTEELVVANATRLTEDRVLTIDRMATLDWVHYVSPRHTLGRLLDQVLNGTSRVVARAPQATAAIHLARAGVGAALVPYALARLAPDLVLHRVDPPMVRELFVVSQAVRRQEVASFINVLTATSLVELAPRPIRREVTAVDGITAAR